MSTDNTTEEESAPYVYVPADNPLPCLICGTVLKSSMDTIDNIHRGFDGIQVNQPSEGTSFITHGNYGSTFFDSFDGSLLEIAVCDDCMSSRTERTRIITVTRAVKGPLKPRELPHTGE